MIGENRAYVCRPSQHYLLRTLLLNNRYPNTRWRLHEINNIGLSPEMKYLRNSREFFDFREVLWTFHCWHVWSFFISFGTLRWRSQIKNKIYFRSRRYYSWECFTFFIWLCFGQYVIEVSITIFHWWASSKIDMKYFCIFRIYTTQLAIYRKLKSHIWIYCIYFYLQKYEIYAVLIMYFSTVVIVEKLLANGMFSF